MKISAGPRPRFPGLRRLRCALIIAICLPVLLPAASASDADTAQRVFRVADTTALRRAVEAANRGGHATIELAAGEYHLGGTLRLTADHITLRSADGNAEGTVLIGAGMRPTRTVKNLVAVSGRHVSLRDLTLREAPNHLVQVVGERDADYFSLVNCRLIDAFEQFLKVSADPRLRIAADDGVVRDSSFVYSAGLGPNDYIGGIDLHRGRGWRIENNRFENIASPTGVVAEHAIHLWSGSRDNIVADNLILNSDRGIGFGLGADATRGNTGGEIRGNVIINLRRDNPFSDVGIALENSPGTVVRDNYVYLAHSYPNAIEYRFAGTTGAVITGNTVNRAIRGRDGAEASVEANETASSLESAWNTLRHAILRLSHGLEP